jgi:hypothetical protein
MFLARAVLDWVQCEQVVVGWLLAWILKHVNPVLSGWRGMAVSRNLLHLTLHTSYRLDFYSLRPKIEVTLGPGTQTNVDFKMTKLPFVYYEKDLGVWELSRVACLLWLVGQSCIFCGTNFKL